MSAPRGFCAGVERAIEIVEKSIQKYGAPVYVRHEIVHNKYVVDDFHYSMGGTGNIINGFEKLMNEEGIDILKGHEVTKIISNRNKITGVELDNQKKIDDILPEAFAVVREASWRTLVMRHFDSQLIGGIVLHEGKIAEMKTGEGKTLMALRFNYSCCKT